jgi:hypothetical protein
VEMVERDAGLDRSLQKCCADQANQTHPPASDNAQEAGRDAEAAPNHNRDTDATHRSRRMHKVGYLNLALVALVGRLPLLVLCARQRRIQVSVNARRQR